ncbi:hypothetical protein D3C72_2375710 [compost metagenome]
MLEQRLANDFMATVEHHWRMLATLGHGMRERHGKPLAISLADEALEIGCISG